MQILLKLIGKTNSRAKLPDGTKPEPEVLPADGWAKLARVWIELEYLKREIRGIPRLKATDIAITAKGQYKRLQRAVNNLEPFEVDAEVTESDEGATGNP